MVWLKCNKCTEMCMVGLGASFSCSITLDFSVPLLYNSPHDFHRPFHPSLNMIFLSQSSRLTCAYPSHRQFIDHKETCSLLLTMFIEQCHMSQPPMFPTQSTTFNHQHGNTHTHAHPHHFQCKHCRLKINIKSKVATLKFS